MTGDSDKNDNITQIEKKRGGKRSPKTLCQTSFGQNENAYHIRFKTINEIGNLPNGAYGLPLTDQFPIADAIIQPDTLIQFTTSPKKHKGSLTNLTDVRAQLRAPFNEHRLIFVIPKENLDTFVYHTELKDIRQFICLPDPSVMVPKSLMNKTERKRWISKK